jgi:hypothetical protein
MTLMSSKRLAEHILELGAAFGVHVEIQDMRPEGAGAGVQLGVSMGAGGFKLISRPIIVIAPVTDETTYAVALHELGHHLHPLGMVASSQGSPTFRATGQYSSLRDVRLKLDEERSAWEWARHYALDWTESMTMVEQFGLDSYKRAMRRFGVRE